VHGNSNPDVLRIRLRYAVEEEKGFRRVRAFDFEALGSVVEIRCPDVMKNAGREEELLRLPFGPGAVFALSEAAFGVEVDAEAVV
jgi:hypothetical protein